MALGGAKLKHEKNLLPNFLKLIKFEVIVQKDDQQTFLIVFYKQ